MSVATRSLMASAALFLFSGCGGNKAEPLVLKKIELTNAHAAELEQLGRKPSPQEVQQIQQRIAAIQASIVENEQALEKFSIAELRVEFAKHKTELDQALQRLIKAEVWPKKKAS